MVQEMTARSDHLRGDNGGAMTPLMLAVLAIVAAVAVGAGHVGGAAVASARAQAVADAAALAGAVGGDGAAQDVVRANEAELVSTRRSGAVLTVRVGVGAAQARAAAVPDASVGGP